MQVNVDVTSEQEGMCTISLDGRVLYIANSYNLEQSLSIKYCILLDTIEMTQITVENSRINNHPFDISSVRIFK